MMDAPDNVIDYFRVKAEESFSKQTRDNLIYAVDALRSFAGDRGLDYSSFTDSMIGEWVSSLLFQGYTPQTISNNVLKRVATLYNKAVEEGKAKPTSVFRDFMNALTAENIDKSGIGKSNIFNKIQDIIRKDYSSNPRRQLNKDIVLFSIFMGGMSFDEIANFHKDGYSGDSEAILEIVNRYSRPKNKYLFPLNRFHSTPKKLNRSVECMFFDVLRDNGLELSTNPSNTSYLLWACAAISCGIPVSDVAACIAPRNKLFPITAFAKPSEISQGRALEIRKSVASTLNYNPVRWYAMHLRPHIDFKLLTDRLKERGIVLDEIYYPMEDVFRKIGKKKIFESQPVIAWLVFYRARATLLNRLFREIGDLAWGYRHIPDLKSQYAVIPDWQIRHYQESIGTLSPSTKILSDKEVKFNEGDYLVVLGGVFDGQHAVFISEKRLNNGSAGGKIVYRVKLAGGTNANWVVERDPNLVRRISESQYLELDRKLKESLLDFVNVSPKIHQRIMERFVDVVS